MIPFQKIFTLAIRTFSRPMLTLMKKKQQQGKLASFRWFFVGLGRRYQIFEHWLNHKMLKTTHKKQLSELKEEVLLEKGVEAFYELAFYCIVIGLPMYELYKSAESADKKEVKLKTKIDSMQKKLDTANNGLATMIDHLGKNKNYADGLRAEREIKLQELMRSRERQRMKAFEQLMPLLPQEPPQTAQQATQTELADARQSEGEKKEATDEKEQ